MYAILYALGAVLSMGLVVLMAYRRDNLQGRPTEGPLRWIGEDRHWHSVGHALLDFIATTMLFAFSVSGMVAIAFWTQSLNSIQWLFLLMLGCPHGFIALLMAPIFLAVLCYELFYDGHWRVFVGKDPEWRDFLFDLATHLLGSVSAGFCALMALEALRLAPVIGVIQSLMGF